MLKLFIFLYFYVQPLNVILLLLCIHQMHVKLPKLSNKVCRVASIFGYQQICNNMFATVLMQLNFNNHPVGFLIPHSAQNLPLTYDMAGAAIFPFFYFCL